MLISKVSPVAFGFLPAWPDPSWRGRRWRSRTGRSTPGVSRGWSATRDLRRRACPEQNPTTESIGRRLIRSGWESPFRWTIRWGLPCWVWKEDDTTYIKIYFLWPLEPAIKEIGSIKLWNTYKPRQDWKVSPRRCGSTAKPSRTHVKWLLLDTAEYKLKYVVSAVCWFFS